VLDLPHYPEDQGNQASGKMRYSLYPRSYQETERLTLREDCLEALGAVLRLPERDDVALPPLMDFLGAEERALF